MRFPFSFHAILISTALAWLAQPDAPSVLPHPPVELDVAVEPDPAWSTIAHGVELAREALAAASRAAFQ